MHKRRLGCAAVGGALQGIVLEEKADGGVYLAVKRSCKKPADTTP